MFIRLSKTAAFKFEEFHPLSPLKQLAMGLSSALLNPENAIFYLTLMTVIIGENATLAQQSFVGIWMTSLVFFWNVGVAAVISHRKAQEVLSKRIPCIERVAGGVFVLFGGVVLVRFVLSLA